MSDSDVPLLAAGVIVFRDRRTCAEVLVVKSEWYGTSLPFGQCDGDEAPMATAVRELEEETGLVAKLDPHPVMVRMAGKRLAHVFVALEYEGAPRPGDDADAVEWAPPAVLFDEELPFAEWNRAAIEAARERAALPDVSTEEERRLVMASIGSITEPGGMVPWLAQATPAQLGAILDAIRTGQPLPIRAVRYGVLGAALDVDAGVTLEPEERDRRIDLLLELVERLARQPRSSR